MATTMKLIAKNTVSGSTAASVVFSSIPGTYTDLWIMAMARNSSSLSTLNIQFNGDTASNYSFRRLIGNGAAASSDSDASEGDIWIGLTTASTNTADTFASNSIYVPNYAGSTNKSVSGESATETNATTAYIQCTAGLWASTAAITSVTLAPDTGEFAIGSSFYLFGITKS